MRDWGWAILAVYVVGFVVTYRVAYRRLAKRWLKAGLTRRSSNMRTFDAMYAGILAWGWPLVTVAMGVYLILTPEVESERRRS